MQDHQDASRAMSAKPRKAWRLAAAWLAAILAHDATAQQLQIPEVIYPTLTAHAATAQGFVPKGWKLETLLKGDLDGDGRDDLVLVLHQQDPHNVVEHDGLGESPLDTNPRMLAVAFAQPAGGYALVLSNHDLITRRDDPVLDDVFEGSGGVSIGHGTLQVALHMWASAGSWGTSMTSYTFRWQHGRFELIGYDLQSYMRNSGDEEGLSINYSTGKVKRWNKPGEADPDAAKAGTHWEKLASPKRWSLDEIGDGMGFQPLPQ